MRRLILLALVLAGCRMAAEAPASDLRGIVDEEITVSALGEDPEGLVERDLPTAPPAPPSEVAPPTEETARVAVSPQQALCERAGGSWASVGASGRVCVKPMADAGKSCRKEGDCRGECLAQSGTCAPIAPLMGCNEVLDDQGRRMTQCLQ